MPKQRDFVPTVLTELAREGYVADRAERRNGRVSHDWAGFADVIGLKRTSRSRHDHSRSVVLVQACRSDDVRSRCRKMLSLESVRSLARQPYVSIEIWGFDRRRSDESVDYVYRRWLLRPQTGGGIRLIAPRE